MKASLPFNALSLKRKVGSAAKNSLELELSFGVGGGIGVSILGPRARAVATAGQTHSWNLGTGEYRQRNHISAEARFDVWKDKIGASAGAGTGFTYSSLYGYLFENGRIVPTNEWVFAAYFFDAEAGWISEDRNRDFFVNLGFEKYKVVGGGFNISFNVSEFFRQMQGCE